MEEACCSPCWGNAWEKNFPFFVVNTAFVCGTGGVATGSNWVMFFEGTTKSKPSQIHPCLKFQSGNKWPSSLPWMSWGTHVFEIVTLFLRKLFGLFWKEPLGAWICVFMEWGLLCHHHFHWVRGNRNVLHLHPSWIQSLPSQRSKVIGSGWWSYLPFLGITGSQEPYAIAVAQLGSPSIFDKMMHSNNSFFFHPCHNSWG